MELYENENEIITIRNKKGGITTVPTDIKRKIRDTMNSTLDSLDDETIKPPLTTHSMI